MGQHQLILMAVAIVIVAFSVAVGIPIFKEQIKKDSSDRAAAAALVMASKVIDWKSRSSLYGGGQDVDFLTGLTLKDLGYPPNGSDRQSEFYETDQLRYRLRALDSEVPRLQVRDLNGQSQVEVGMYGPAANCLVIRKRFQGGSLGEEGGRDEVDTGLPAMPADCTGW